MSALLLYAMLAAPSNPTRMDTVNSKGTTWIFVNEFLDYEQADLTCRTLGARLAVLSSAEDLWFVHNQLHDGPRLNDSSWTWIGEARFGIWRGADPAPMVIQFSWDGTPELALRHLPPDSRQKALCQRPAR